MTERLYYTDSYLTEFEGHVVEADPGRVRLSLNRTAFYPTSGGQQNDYGLLNGIRVLDVVDEDNSIVHVLEAPLTEDTVKGQVDWSRRFDHMQQHSGQHLLSAVFAELFDIPTVSVHLGAQSSTVDLGVATLDPSRLQVAERRANEIVFENRPVSVAFEDASEVEGLRKESSRTGTLRIVSIDGLDRSACGGTHVRRTGEIGPILLRKLDKIRGNVRLEFLCGNRAIARSRADYEALNAVAKVFSSSLDDAPAMVAAQADRIRELDKSARAAIADLAGYRGREIYSQTESGVDGVRRYRHNAAAIDEEARALAQSFAAQPKAVAVVLCKQPASVLVAASPDSGVHAGNVVKNAVTSLGGRGGGSAAIAQGSVPSADLLQQLQGLLADAGA